MWVWGVCIHKIYRAGARTQKSLSSSTCLTSFPVKSASQQQHAQGGSLGSSVMWPMKVPTCWWVWLACSLGWYQLTPFWSVCFAFFSFPCQGSFILSQVPVQLLTFQMVTHPREVMQPLISGTAPQLRGMRVRWLQSKGVSGKDVGRAVQQSVSRNIKAFCGQYSSTSGSFSSSGPTLFWCSRLSRAFQLRVSWI